jgi:pimeloyl-ACP methyl ester carboxylesterase
MVGEPKTGVSRKDASWVRLAGLLQKQGCAVLTFDFRGFGENRTSKDVNAALFWKYPENWSLPGFKPKNPARAPAPALDGMNFRHSYMPWLVQDIVAARFYLDTQHDFTLVNTQNLIIVGAGEGAALTSFWLAGEWKRHKSIRGLRADAPSEGRDIIAAAWIDPSPNLAGFAISTALTNLQRQLKSEKALPPMQFLYERKAFRAEGRTRTMMKALHQKASAEKAIDTDSAVLIGQAFVGNPAAEKAVLEFVTEILKKHEMRPHTTRLLRPNDWYWSFGTRSVLAKGLFADVPGAFPVDVFGFKVR